MESPAEPANESARQDELDQLDIVDSPAEERFDRVTRMARAMFVVPIALVSLVDRDRQWFKSKQGLTACETGRDISFCGHAVLQSDVFWVADASTDPRFHDNPLVTDEPNIRFYAGYPLRGPAGHRIGTLCIIDRVPREHSRSDVQLLSDLGRVVEEELRALQLGHARLDGVGQLPAERKLKLDPLTGMWNRAGILEIVELGLAACANVGRSATVLACEPCDPDRPDEDWAPMAGSDLVTAELAQALRRGVEGFDSIGRYDQGRFVMLLAGVRSEDAQEHVDAIRRRVGAGVGLASIGLGLRCGHATLEPDSSAVDAHALIRQALESLEAHRAGGDRRAA